MSRFVLALVLLVAGSTCFGDETKFSKADAAYGVRMVEEHVVSLPQDQDKPYLTVIGDKADSKFQSVTNWFGDNKTLEALKDQCHFNAVATDSAHYKERLAADCPVTPCVRLQTANGDIVYEMVGNDIPMTSDALAKAINGGAMKAESFRKCRPEPKKPNKPDTDPKPQPLAPTPPRTGGFPWLLLVGLSVGAGLLGLIKQWHDTYYAVSAPTKRV